MLSINTNLSSLIAQNSMSKSTNALNQAIERMSTGYKINHAKDNAANYSISTNMTTQLGSYKVAEENCSMGLDMLSTADDNLSLISDKLQRLRDLQTQASNGTYGEQSLQAINAEANALVDEIERIYANAEYNGKKLFEKAETQAVAQVATYGARAATSGKFINNVSQRNTDGMTKLSSITDESVELASGTYSISTPAELEKLARLANARKLNSSNSYEFVLAKDIDMSSVSNWVPIGNDIFGGLFYGTFDGNGYAIKNLTIKNRTDLEYAGLFAFSKGTIKNLGVENINIENSGTMWAYGVAAAVVEGKVENCYTTGNINSLGGASGIGVSAEVIDCYSTVTLSSDFSSGNETTYMILGLGMNCTNSFFAGKIIMDVPIDDNHVAMPAFNEDGYVSYYVENWTDPETIAELEAWLQASGEDIDYGISKNIAELEAMYGIDLSSAPSAGGGTGGGGTGGGGTGGGGAGTGGGAGASVAGNVSLQVGINSDNSSQISLEFSFSLAGVDGLRMIGLDTTTDYLSKIDKMLESVSAKQTEYGSVQNRLESVLDEILIRYDNLISSRSTIMDSDIAEVSSEYIRHQILQQASATLMSTANQLPAIALDLI